jgi:AAA domain
MYKTFGVLDLAGAVILGKPFAGRKILRKGGVLLIAAEGVSEVRKRLAGLFEKKYGTEEPQAFVWVEECPTLHGNKKALDILVAIAKAAQHELKSRFDVPLSLIIVDTLAAAAGFENENDAAQAQGVMTILQKVSTATGAFCLAVDHFGKSEESGTRGSIAKESSAETVLAFLGTRAESGAVSNSRMAVRKSRAGKQGYFVPFKAQEVELGEDRDGDPVTTCIIEWGEEGTAPVEKKKPDSVSVYALRVAVDECFKNGSDEALYVDGKPMRGVKRAKVLEAFKRSYKGKDSGANQAMLRALETSKEELPLVPFQGAEYSTRGAF